MTTTYSTRPQVWQLQWMQSLVWLTFALSSVVFIEPAPYDALVLLLIALLYPLKLRVPSEVGIAVFLLALFTVGNLIGALASSDPETSLRPLITRTFMVVSWVFFVSLLVADTDALIKVFWSGYRFAALLAAVWGCLEYYDLLPQVLAGDAFGRAKGPFKDANVFGPFLIPAALHMIYRMLHSRGSVLLLEASQFLVIALGLLLSFSRGAWIDFALAFGLFMLFSVATVPTLKAKLRLITLVVVLGFVAGISLSWAINNTVAGERFADRATLIKAYDVGTGGRFTTQALVIQDIGGTPLGVGPGLSNEKWGMPPHNLFLHTAIEGGWIAGVSFCLFVLLTLYRGFSRALSRWHLQGELQVITAALVGTLFQSLFIDSTHWRHLWLLFAITWALTIAFDRARSDDRRRVMFNRVGQ